MVIHYSIVICTYNPDERLLRRCLNAIYGLNSEGLKVEALLIDNNSTIPLNRLPYIEEYKERMTGLKVIEEKAQGLTFARMAGIREAKGDHIVFFDDDNEPGTDYLQELALLHHQEPQVAVWGPGNIRVDFIDGIKEDIEAHARSVFQERHESHVAYANVRTWQQCYPYGTGMCVKTVYLKEYMNLVNEGHFTSTGRKGYSLSSGEDVQIVLHCIDKGAAAGIAPQLKVNHMIPRSRANYDYIKRLIYGTSIGGSTHTLEVFPEHQAILSSMVMEASQFSKRAIKGYFKLYFMKRPENVFDFIRYLAFNYGIYLALGKPVPAPVYWVIKRLKLD